jgi:transposase
MIYNADNFPDCSRRDVPEPIVAGNSSPLENSRDARAQGLVTVMPTVPGARNSFDGVNIAEVGSGLTTAENETATRHQNLLNSGINGHLTPALFPLGGGEGVNNLGTAGTPSPPAVSLEDVKAAAYRRGVIEAFRCLKTGGLSNQKAARKAGEPYLTIYRWQKLYEAQGFDGLLSRHKNSGRKPKLQLSSRAVAAIRANKELNNRDKNSGSTPLAIRKTIEEGGLSADEGAVLLAREAAGQRMVTPAIANKLHISPIVTRSFRHGRNANLEWNSSPGSLMLTRCETLAALQWSGMETAGIAESGSLPGGSLRFC